MAGKAGDTETRRGGELGAGGWVGLTFSSPHLLLILSLSLSGPLRKEGREQAAGFGKEGELSIP